MSCVPLAHVRPCAHACVYVCALQVLIHCEESDEDSVVANLAHVTNAEQASPAYTTATAAHLNSGVFVLLSLRACARSERVRVRGVCVARARK